MLGTLEEGKCRKEKRKKRISRLREHYKCSRALRDGVKAAIGFCVRDFSSYRGGEFTIVISFRRVINLAGIGIRFRFDRHVQRKIYPVGEFMG